MPRALVHVTTHIHTDGPIPGPHSLLTLVLRGASRSAPADRSARSA